MKFVASLAQNGSGKKTCLQPMAVQCVRRWLWCCAPAFHLSVLHQPYPIPSGIGSCSPSGKGCISRSYILLSPPRVGSASYNHKAQGTFHCRCRVPCWWRSFIAMTTERMTFMSAEFTQEEEFSYSEDVSVDHFVLCYIGVV